MITKQLILLTVFFQTNILVQIMQLYSIWKHWCQSLQKVKWNKSSEGELEYKHF